MHRLLEGSLKQLGPNNPWIKEAQERQHGSMDPRDWPDYDSDEDTGVRKLKLKNTQKRKTRRKRSFSLCRDERTRTETQPAIEYTDLFRARNGKDHVRFIPWWTQIHQIPSVSVHSARA